MIHSDLDVWKKAIEFVAEIYKITKNFPKEEIYGLTSQIRRAAVSIPSNIAEGAARNYKKEFIQFLYIAVGSAAETETQLIIAKEIGYIENNTLLLSEIGSIKKMILGLIKYLKKGQKMKSNMLNNLFLLTNHDLRFMIHDLPSSHSRLTAHHSLPLTIYDSRFTSTHHLRLPIHQQRSST